MIHGSAKAHPVINLATFSLPPFPPLKCQLMSSVKHVEFWAFTLSLSCLTDLFVIAQSQFTGFKDPCVCVCRSSYSKVFPS